MKRVKSLLIFLPFVSLALSCAKEADEPGESLTGDYVLEDDSGLSDTYVSFKDGLFISYSSPVKYTLAENTLWHCQKSNFTKTASSSYTLSGGVLTFLQKTPFKSGSMKDEVLYLDGMTFTTLKRFSNEYWSSVSLPDGNTKELDYTAQEVSIPIVVNRPIPYGELSVSANADWISNLKVVEGNLLFKVPVTKTDASAQITLNYTNAVPVVLAVTRKPSTVVRLNETARTIGYESSHQEIEYAIDNPLPTSFLAVAVIDTSVCVTNLQIEKGRVSFDIKENNCGWDRVVILTLSYGGARDVAFTLTQQWSASEITTIPTSRDVTYAGGSFSFNFAVINPREGLSITAVSQSDWITDVQLSGNTVSYKVAENNSGSSRTGKIKLTYGRRYATKEFSVSQSWSTTEITITPTNQDINYVGGSFSFDFEVTNPREGASVTAVSQSDWITDVQLSGNTVSYKVSENVSYFPRNGKIKLSYGSYVAKEFSVNQSSHPITTFSLNKTEMALLTGNCETLQLTTFPEDVSLVWSSSQTSVAMVSQNGVVTAMGFGTAMITVFAQGGEKTASCEVTVKDTPTFSISRTNLTMLKDSNPGSILITSNSDCQFTATSSDPSVATVSISGKTVSVTPISEGETTITVDCPETQRYVAVSSLTCRVEVIDGSSATDLSSTPANCYIIPQSGVYKFKAVKGNSSTSVGTASTAEVLWESFGTSTAPNKGDIITSVSQSDCYIFFSTPSTLKNGNAVIAAKGSKGNILWSWHIWVCSGYDPTATAQEYNNGAGTMMDRNLGATSATPGDVGALGLLYQWGRKDPFLGGNGISSSTKAASTVTWPSAVASNSRNGTISYAVQNPTTFITYNGSNGDWYYTGSSSTDNKRWSSAKGLYDPCPPGWRVPDGGSNGVWSKAIGSSDYFYYTYDDTNKGMNFNGKFGSSTTIWYPASGCLDALDGSLWDVGDFGDWWSCKPFGDSYGAYRLLLNGRVYPAGSCVRGQGNSVRCIKE